MLGSEGSSCFTATLALCSASSFQPVSAVAMSGGVAVARVRLRPARACAHTASLPGQRHVSYTTVACKMQAPLFYRTVRMAAMVKEDAKRLTRTLDY